MSIKLFNTNLIDLFFYAPPATEQSAGHRSFYLFCDNMIRRGVNSYIIPDIEKFKIRQINDFALNHSSFLDTNYSNLITPLANTSHVLKSFKTNRIPIVIYPETVKGNPLNAPNVIRYLGYYNKKLDEFNVLDNIREEGLVYYSKDIGDNALSSIKYKPLFEQRVSIPVRDINLFKSNIKNEDRKKIYYYGEKYSDPNVFNSKFPKDIKENFIRITRFKNDSPTHEELIEILKSAKLVHIFEDTALIYEALLAGAVVNLHPKGKFFNDNLHASHNEHKTFGLISKEKITEHEIKQKQGEIFKFEEEYLKWIDLSKNDLNNFVQALIKREKKFYKYNKEFVNKAIYEINQFNKFIVAIKFKKNNDKLVIIKSHRINFLILKFMNIKVVKILYKKLLSMLNPKIRFILRKYFLKLFVKF